MCAGLRNQNNIIVWTRIYDNRISWPKASYKIIKKNTKHNENGVREDLEQKYIDTNIKSRYKLNSYSCARLPYCHPSTAIVYVAWLNNALKVILIRYTPIYYVMFIEKLVSRTTKLHYKDSIYIHIIVNTILRLCQDYEFIFLRFGTLKP